MTGAQKSSYDNPDPTLLLVEHFLGLRPDGEPPGAWRRWDYAAGFVAAAVRQRWRELEGSEAQEADGPSATSDVANQGSRVPVMRYGSFVLRTLTVVPLRALGGQKEPGSDVSGRSGPGKPESVGADRFAHTLAVHMTRLGVGVEEIDRRLADYFEKEGAFRSGISLDGGFGAEL